MTSLRLIILSYALCLSGALAAPPQAFKVGHPDLPAGCHPPADIEDQGWTAYLTMLSDRLGRDILGCGTDAGNVPSLLKSGDLDFAFVSSSPADARTEGLPAILRIRNKGMLPRPEVIVLTGRGASLSDYDPLQSAELPASKVLSAFTMSELIALTAVSEGGAIGDPTIQERARAFAGSFADVWPTATATIDPIKAIGRLSDADNTDILFLTQGRYLESCTKKKDLCTDITPVWRGFVPLAIGYATRPTLPKELRYRLIGIHVALHVERPDLLATVGGPDAEELEPAEMTAFRFTSAP